MCQNSRNRCKRRINWPLLRMTQITAPEAMDGDEDEDDLHRGWQPRQPCRSRQPPPKQASGDDVTGIDVMNKQPRHTSSYIYIYIYMMWYVL
ncbi:hypothetical protein FKM82_009145 [Ascaphus truei]